MIVQLPTQTHNHLADGVAVAKSGGDEIVATTIQIPSSSSAPKKRAETWVQEETRALISFRKEIDSLFNTSKSNKHLWENISLKMREKGFDRSATMCTDKWRNLLKEFKKVKTSNRDGNGNGSAKMGYYKEIEEILKERSKDGSGGEGVSKIDSFMQFSDKGIDDASLTFGPMEDNGRSTLNLERHVDHDGDPLAITAADAVAASGASPWGWRETPADGEQSNINYGKVITVKLGDYIKRVGIDGTHDAIKEAIRSFFRLRSKRAFWLEDEYNVVRTIDREMPIGNYTLHVDEGWSRFVKRCAVADLAKLIDINGFKSSSETSFSYLENDIHFVIAGLTIKVVHENVRTENRTFFTEEDYHEFLSRHGWTCLQECNSFRCIVCMDDLCPGAMYRGVD